MNRPKLGPCLIAEFFGTMLLVLMGTGVVANVTLLGKESGWVIITLGWGMAVALAVYVTGRIGGGHLNPAVTLALALRGDFPASRVLPYWLVQIAGAMAGAAIIYADYSSAFLDFEASRYITRGQILDGKLAGNTAGGAGVFATFPAFDNIAGNLLSEFLGTAVLLIGVRALTDRRNAAPGRGFEPLLVGALVTAIGLCLGGLTGYAINPARDFGPRTVAAMAGWGWAVFTSHGYYFWIPIVAPLVGGVCGIWCYDLLIAPYLPPEDQPAPPGTVAP